MRIENNTNNVAFSAVRVRPYGKSKAARSLREVMESGRHVFEKWNAGDVLFFHDIASQDRFCVELKRRKIPHLSTEVGFTNSTDYHVKMAITGTLSKLKNFAFT